MPNFSDHLESGLLMHVFRAETFPKPATLAVAVTLGVPTDAQTGATLNEVGNANGYARVTLGAPSNSLWSNTNFAGVGSGQIHNTAAISFPQCITANWGTVSGVAVVDNATYGAGSVLVWGSLSTPKNVTVGDTLSFPSGALVIEFR